MRALRRKLGLLRSFIRFAKIQRGNHAEKDKESQFCKLIENQINTTLSTFNHQFGFVMEYDVNARRAIAISPNADMHLCAEYDYSFLHTLGMNGHPPGLSTGFEVPVESVFIKAGSPGVKGINEVYPKVV